MKLRLAVTFSALLGVGLVAAASPSLAQPKNPMEQARKEDQDRPAPKAKPNPMEAARKEDQDRKPQGRKVQNKKKTEAAEKLRGGKAE
jgi:hypothetical protein